MITLPPNPFDTIALETERRMLKDNPHLHLIGIREVSLLNGANVVVTTRDETLYRAHLLVDPAMTMPEAGILGVFNEATGGVRLDPGYVEKVVHTDILKKAPVSSLVLKVPPTPLRIARERKGKSKYTRKRKRG